MVLSTYKDYLTEINEQEAINDNDKLVAALLTVASIIEDCVNQLQEEEIIHNVMWAIKKYKEIE
jgi:hypothetical protein